MVVHLITDDIYIDIKLLSWSSGGTGGGFSYERSTDQSLGLNELNSDLKLKLFPNPSKEFIQISGLTKNEKYTVFNILGTEVNNGIIANNGQIDIRDFSNGVYFLKFKDGNTIKFIRK